MTEIDESMGFTATQERVWRTSSHLCYYIFILSHFIKWKIKQTEESVASGNGQASHLTSTQGSFTWHQKDNQCLTMTGEGVAKTFVVVLNLIEIEEWINEKFNEYDESGDTI